MKTQVLCASLGNGVDKETKLLELQLWVENLPEDKKNYVRTLEVKDSWIEGYEEKK